MTCEIGPATPFFIVSDMVAALAHYCDGLGFESRFRADEADLFFALVGLGSTQIMLKDVGVAPLPNAARHPDAPWDAFIFAPEPEAFRASCAGRGASGLRPITIRDDGLHGFEVADPDGYVCFFGHPI